MNAFGFRVKSGHAIAVILSGSVETPSAVGRHIVELCDPDLGATPQPYHAGLGQAEEDATRIGRLITIFEQAADRSVSSLLRAHGSSEGSRAGLVVGSVIDPAAVGNPHIRAHANEGQLFRTVLARALSHHQIESSILVERDLAGAARKRLGRSDVQIQRVLATFGAVLGRPWRSDEKAAATAAWMALAGS